MDYLRSFLPLLRIIATSFGKVMRSEWTCQQFEEYYFHGNFGEDEEEVTYKEGDSARIYILTRAGATELRAQLMESCKDSGYFGAGAGAMVCLISQVQNRASS